MNILQTIRSRFAGALQKLHVPAEQYLGMIKPAQDAKFGDFQANCAMPLAKRLGKSPQDIAKELVAQLDVRDLCDTPEIAGPGFINLRLKADWLTEQINNLISDEKLGIETNTDPRKIVIDFSSPNVAKPMHVGHLRSTVIGDALARIMRFLGHDVVTDNHIGDWGTQFGMIIFGYKNLLDEQAYATDPVTELARLYRLVNRLSEFHAAVAEIPLLEQQISAKEHELKQSEQNTGTDKTKKKALKKQRGQIEELKAQLSSAQKKRVGVEQDEPLKQLADRYPNIAREARDETAKLHNNDPENKRLWEQFLPQCLSALQQVYDRLSIRFELALGESFYQPWLGDVVASLRERGIAEESQQAICVFLKGHEAPFIIQKSDGAYTYATTDLATIRYRIETLGAQEILYIVDARQSEHFEQLFATALQWGYADTQFEHVRFGTVMGSDKRPFKTRSGDNVGLESLLDEAVAKARVIVDENDDAKTDNDGQPAPELDQQQRQQIAETIGIGGIKYADLNHNRESDYVFNWEKMLAKNGDTATYMQYSYARVAGIFRRGGFEREAVRNSGRSVAITHPAERALALKLCRFTEAIEDAASDYRPNLLTSYLFETANTFSTFFDSCPVLKAEDPSIRDSRLLLCDITARVMSQGLALLGIETCERM